MPGSASGRRYVASMRKGGESSHKSTDENGNGKPEEAPPPASASSGGVVYRECMRNYAASSGGYAVDGCRQFTAKGDVGTPDAFKCAVCNCHRNFHRQEVLHSSCHCQRERDRS